MADRFLPVYGGYAVVRPDAVLKELPGLFDSVEAAVERAFYLCTRSLERSVHLVVGDALEVHYLLLPVHHEPEGHGLHAACGQASADFPPEYGGELESHQTVQHAASLLRIHEVEVYVPGILDGVEYGVPGDFVEYDSAGARLVESERFAQMPGDGLPFAVFIGCEPYRSGFGCSLPEFRDDLLLGRRDGVFRFETVFDVHAQLVALKVADVSEAGFHHIAFSQKFLNCFRLRWRFDNN